MPLKVDTSANQFPHRYQLVRTIDLPDTGITFPLKEAYDFQNRQLDPHGISHKYTESIPLLADLKSPKQDMWIKLDKIWIRLHPQIRTTLFNPRNEQTADGTGPEIGDLSYHRHTIVCVNRAETYHITDTWNKDSAEDPRHRWTGLTMLYKKGVTGHKEDTNLTTAQTDATQQYTTAEPRSNPYPVKVDRTKPYSGELPPQPLDPSIDPKTFIQDPVTKIWAKRNALGHLRKVDNVGNEWYTKPILATQI